MQRATSRSCSSTAARTCPRAGCRTCSTATRAATSATSPDRSKSGSRPSSRCVQEEERWRERTPAMRTRIARARPAALSSSPTTLFAANFPDGETLGRSAGPGVQAGLVLRTNLSEVRELEQPSRAEQGTVSQIDKCRRLKHTDDETTMAGEEPFVRSCCTTGVEYDDDDGTARTRAALPDRPSRMDEAEAPASRYGWPRRSSLAVAAREAHFGVALLPRRAISPDYLRSVC